LKLAKTYNEAAHTSNRAAVIAKKKQILQLDGCFLSPLPSKVYNWLLKNFRGKKKCKPVPPSSTPREICSSNPS
jgi:hypothetical protein